MNAVLRKWIGDLSYPVSAGAIEALIAEVERLDAENESQREDYAALCADTGRVRAENARLHRAPPEKEIDLVALNHEVEELWVWMHGMADSRAEMERRIKRLEGMHRHDE
jgi:hypothetical protein